MRALTAQDFGRGLLLQPWRAVPELDNQLARRKFNFLCRYRPRNSKTQKQDKIRLAELQNIPVCWFRLQYENRCVTAAAPPADADADLS